MRATRVRAGGCVAASRSPADRALATAEGDHSAEGGSEVAPVAHAHGPAIGLELAAMADDVADGVGGVEGGEERPESTSAAPR